MSFLHFSEQVKVIQGLPPVADLFNTGPTTDWVSLQNYSKAAFIVEKGAGATGTATLKVQAASDNAGTGAEDIPFSYRAGDADGTDLGDLTAVAATGFTTAAAANKLILIEVESANLPAGKPFIALDTTEVDNDPVAGSVLIQLFGGRFQGATLPDAV